MEDDAILGVLALMAVGFVIGVVVFLVAMALLLTIILGPPVLAGYGLWQQITVHQLSHKKAWQTAGVGLALLLMPVLLLLCAVPAHEVFAPNNNISLVALWIGIVLGLACSAGFIAFSAFRQTQWPHYKAIWNIKQELRAQRARLWLSEMSLHQIDEGIARHQERENEIIEEYERLGRLVDDLVREHDPALYSAERLRLQRECAEKDATILERQLASLNHELSRTDKDEPQYITLTLQAGVVRLETLNKLLGVGKGATYEDATTKRCQLLKEIEGLNREVESLETQRLNETATIQQARQMQVAIQ